MGVWRRVVSLNGLFAALALVYPPLAFVPIGALFGSMVLVSGLWTINHFWIAPSVSTMAPPRLRVKARPAQAQGLGQPVRDFEFTDASGGRQVLSVLMAHSRTILYLYSAYCGHCANRLPRFADFAQEADRLGVRIIGVQWRGNSGTLNATHQQTPIPGALVADPTGEFCASVGVGEFTVFLLDPDRTLLHRSGGEDFTKLAALLPR